MSLTKIQRLSLTSLLFPLFASAPACTQADQHGVLTVRYQFGAAAGAGGTCESTGVEQIRVSLDGQVYAEEDCDADRTFSISNVPARTYSRVFVEGLDGTGTTVRDNAGTDSVEVQGGSEVTLDVAMMATPARLRFQFIMFDETGIPLAPAATPPIKNFVVGAFRNGGDSSLLSHTFVVAMLESLQVDVPDPDRRLNGQDLDFVTLGIVDQSDATVETLDWTFEAPGAGRLVLIRVECRGVDCTGEVQLMEGEIEPVDPEDEEDGDTD